MAAVVLILVAIPLVAYAKSRNANPQTKTNSPAKVQAIIEKKIELPPFPVGRKEVKTTRPTTRAPKAPQRASVSVTGAKLFIYMMESGNRTNAINRYSGACGLGQALPCSKMPCSLSDYACQDRFFTAYMKARYGTWENAKRFWECHRWW